jgi:hypothetical protein
MLKAEDPRPATMKEKQNPQLTSFKNSIQYKIPLILLNDLVPFPSPPSLPPPNNRLISRIHLLPSLLFNMLPLNVIWLARIPPHVLLALLRLFRLRSTGLARVADGCLNGSRVGAACARLGGAAAVDTCAGRVGSCRGLGAGRVFGGCGCGGAVVGGGAGEVWRVEMSVSDCKVGLGGLGAGESY